MANKPTLELIKEIVATFVENTNGDIDATKLQTQLIDIVQSRGLFEQYDAAKGDASPSSEYGYIPPEHVTFSDNNIYRCIANANKGESPSTHPAKWEVVGGVGSVTAAVVEYTNNGFVNVEQALDDHHAKLSALIPDAPDGMAGQEITMTTYQARESGTGAVQSCTDDRTPDGGVTGIYDASNGTLTVEIDSVEDGSVVLDNTDSTGNYDSLVITGESDPYLGQLGQGIYKVFDAVVRSVAQLSYEQHNYKMIHTITGESLVLSFYVDDPSTATSTIGSIVLPVSATKYVSGVPCLKANDEITATVTVLNAVGKHYSNANIALLYSDQTSTKQFGTPATPPGEGDSVVVTGLVVINSNAAVDDLELKAIGYNSKQVGGTETSLSTNVYIDDVSDESERLKAGSGEYPASGYGLAFDSTVSLKTSLTEELQLKHGVYQYPNGNYTLNNPTSGDDYSTGMGALDRWVMINTNAAITNAAGLTIGFVNPAGFGSDVETANIKIQIKVDGVTGWLDANKPFSLVGSPQANGDACMVVFDSFSSSKRVSFGDTLRTGIVYVRVGLPAGDTKTFESIIVKDIV